MQLIVLDSLSSDKLLYTFHRYNRDECLFQTPLSVVFLDLLGYLRQVLPWRVLAHDPRVRKNLFRVETLRRLDHK